MEKQEFLAVHMTEFKDIPRQSISNEILEKIVRLPQESRDRMSFTAPDVEGFTFQDIHMDHYFIMHLPKFTHCKFINGSFFGSWVMGASFENCLMQSFGFGSIDFIHSNEFKNCVFYDCHFQGTIMLGLFIENCCFIECDLRYLRIHNSYLKDTTFVKCVGLDSVVYDDTINEHVESI